MLHTSPRLAERSLLTAVASIFSAAMEIGNLIEHEVRVVYDGGLAYYRIETSGKHAEQNLNRSLSILPACSLPGLHLHHSLLIQAMRFVAVL